MQVDVLFVCILWIPFCYKNDQSAIFCSKAGSRHGFRDGTASNIAKLYVTLVGLGYHHDPPPGICMMAQLIKSRQTLGFSIETWYSFQLRLIFLF